MHGRRKSGAFLDHRADPSPRPSAVARLRQFRPSCAAIMERAPLPRKHPPRNRPRLARSAVSRPGTVPSVVALDRVRRHHLLLAVPRPCAGFEYRCCAHGSGAKGFVLRFEILAPASFLFLVISPWMARFLDRHWFCPVLIAAASTAGLGFTRFACRSTSNRAPSRSGLARFPLPGSALARYPQQLGSECGSIVLRDHFNNSRCEFVANR